MSIPWFPFYVDDYAGDTLHLTTVQHGAYLLLMLHYWRKGGLPTDDASLAAIARLSGREWARHRPVLAALFDAGWRHARIDEERLKATKKSAVRAEAGARGGTSKSLKTKDTTVAIARDLPEQTDGNPVEIALASSPESRVQKELIPQQPSCDSAPEAAAADPPGRAELVNRFDRMQALCANALGDQAPCDLVIGPMLDLLKAGFAEAEIAEALIRVSRKPRREPLRRWSGWATAIRPELDAMRAASAAVAAPAAAAKPWHEWNGQAFDKATIYAAVAAWRADPASWDAARLGPPPGADGSAVAWWIWMTDEEKRLRARGGATADPERPALRVVN